MNGNYRNQQAKPQQTFLSPSSSTSHHNQQHQQQLQQQQPQQQQQSMVSHYHHQLARSVGSNANEICAPSSYHKTLHHPLSQQANSKTSDRFAYRQDFSSSRLLQHPNSPNHHLASTPTRMGTVKQTSASANASQYHTTSAYHLNDELEAPSDRYADQLRQAQINYRIGPQPEDTSSGVKQTMHVNFNRSSRGNDLNRNQSNQNGTQHGSSQIYEDEEEEEQGRKKKYLTAKYGQQQMNLIKKRLKIETWLYEELQNLAKGSKSEGELDEIDIDLDQLLDMENDDTRRRWLKKTLEPFEDLPSDRVDTFIGQVLEQSKLL